MHLEVDNTVLFVVGTLPTVKSRSVPVSVVLMTHKLELSQTMCFVVLGAFPQTAQTKRVIVFAVDNLEFLSILQLL